MAAINVFNLKAARGAARSIRLRGRLHFIGISLGIDICRAYGRRRRLISSCSCEPAALESTNEKPIHPRFKIRCIHTAEDAGICPSCTFGQRQREQRRPPPPDHSPTASRTRTERAAPGVIQTLL